MGQDEFRRPLEILRQDELPPRERRFGAGRLDEIDIGAMPGHVGFQGIDGSQADHGIGNLDGGKVRPRRLDFLPECFRFLLPGQPEGGAVPLEIQHPPDNLGPFRHLGGRFDRDEKAEMVEGGW